MPQFPPPKNIDDLAAAQDVQEAKLQIWANQWNTTKQKEQMMQEFAVLHQRAQALGEVWVPPSQEAPQVTDEDEERLKSVNTPGINHWVPTPSILDWVPPPESSEQAQRNSASGAPGGGHWTPSQEKLPEFFHGEKIDPFDEDIPPLPIVHLEPPPKDPPGAQRKLTFSSSEEDLWGSFSPLREYLLENSSSVEKDSLDENELDLADIPQKATADVFAESDPDEML